MFGSLRRQTQFEAWLALQTASARGLAAAEEADCRCEIVCIHTATEGAEDVKLRQIWAGATPEKAQRVLNMPDVLVTNSRPSRIEPRAKERKLWLLCAALKASGLLSRGAVSDKEIQIAKIGHLNDAVRNALA